MATVPAVKRFLLHRTVLAVFVTVAFWGTLATFNWFAAPGRIDPRLLQVMEQQPYIERVAVTFAFQPEDFHLNKLQKYGIVAGVQNQSIFLVQLRTDRLWKLAELYWIQEIKLAE